jgi:DNA-directed RNA polymerase specialized sigma24 family protein
VFTALCLVTGDRHEAEEIAQDAFVRVFERWDRVGSLEDPTGYLFRATGDAWRVADGASAIWLDDHTLLVEA